MSDIPSPETNESKGDAEKVKLGNNWGGQTLTVTEFTELMKKHMKTGRWT